MVSEKPNVRLDCNWCPYAIQVSERLVPWAIDVMTKHAERLHFKEVQDAKARQERLRSNQPQGEAAQQAGLEGQSPEAPAADRVL